MMTIQIGDRTIEFIEGDITRQDSDAIVNAANSSLMGGGGVDGAIHAAGGPAILEACKTIIARQGDLPTGKAVATTAGEMRARHVIHTVGPIWYGGEQGEPEQLANCYRNCLRLAEQMKIASVAFPSISTGAYGYPLREAAEIAVKTVAEVLQHTANVKLVRFVLFGGHAYDVYTGIAAGLNQSAENRE